MGFPFFEGPAIGLVYVGHLDVSKLPRLMGAAGLWE